MNQPVTKECYQVVQEQFKAENQSYFFEFNWDEERPVAFAVSIARSLIVSGGMARGEGLNLGGFVTIVCHELGHLKFQYTEGEADYYATNICLPAYIEKFINVKEHITDERVANFCQSLDSLSFDYCILISSMFNNAAEFNRLFCVEKVKNLDPSEVLKKLNSNKSTKQKHQSCLLTSQDYPKIQRGSIESIIIQTQQKLNFKLSFNNKDQRRVTKEYKSHNSPQCRIDTFIAGLLGQAKPRCWSL